MFTNVQLPIAYDYTVYTSAASGLGNSKLLIIDSVKLFSFDTNTINYSFCLNSKIIIIKGEQI